jgi:two-component system response regulator HydG
MLASMLRSLTPEILEAGDDDTAVSMLERRPGLALIGISPEDPDALRLLSYTRHRFPGLPAILLSSADPAGFFRQALRIGATAVLKYPLPATQLRASVIQALGPREAHRRSGGVDQPGAGSATGMPLSPGTPPEQESRPDRPADAAPCICHPRPVDWAAVQAGMPIRPLQEALEGPERAIILHALTACGGCRYETARALGVNRSTLYKKMKRLGILDE